MVSIKYCISTDDIFTDPGREFRQARSDATSTSTTRSKPRLLDVWRLVPNGKNLISQCHSLASKAPDYPWPEPRHNQTFRLRYRRSFLHTPSFTEGIASTNLLRRPRTDRSGPHPPDSQLLYTPSVFKFEHFYDNRETPTSFWFPGVPQPQQLVLVGLGSLSVGLCYALSRMLESRRSIQPDAPGSTVSDGTLRCSGSVQRNP